MALDYRLPYNRDFSATINFDGKLIQPTEEVGYVDSPFAVVAPAASITGHPRLTAEENFNISPYSLLFEQPPGGGVQEYVEWARPFEFINEELWGQLYAKLSMQPPAAWTLFRFVDASDAVGTRLQVNADGSLQWYVGANPVSGSSIFKLAPGLGARLEWYIKFSSAAQATLVLNIYGQDDINQWTKNIETVRADGVSTLLNSGNRLQVGWVSGSQPGDARLYVGGLSLSDEEFVGPALWYYDPDMIGDYYYEQLQPIVDEFGDPNEHLRTYVRAIGRMQQPLYDLVMDGPRGEPGWSQTLDPKRMKPKWLPWASQLVGYRAPEYRGTDDVSAYLIRHTTRMKKFSSHKRGSTDTLRDIVKENLWGRRRVIIYERAGDLANHIRVYIYDDDIIAGMTVEDLEQIARAQKMVGLIMGFTVLTGTNNYNLLKGNNANYATLKAKHATYQSAQLNPSA